MGSGCSCEHDLASLCAKRDSSRECTTVAYLVTKHSQNRTVTERNTLMEQIRGKIAAVLDRTTIVINRGSLDGVSRGLVFYIYTELGPFTDPDTGEDLGTIPQVWGRVVVSNVADRLCIAGTEYEYTTTWGLDRALLRGVLGERVQIKLPIDESQISGWPTKVDVGTEVISERPSSAAVTAEEEVEALPASSEAVPAPPSVDSESPEEPHLPQLEGDTPVHNDSNNRSE